MQGIKRRLDSFTLIFLVRLVLPCPLSGTIFTNKHNKGEILVLSSPEKYAIGNVLINTALQELLN